MTTSTRRYNFKWLVLVTLIITAILIMAGSFCVEQTPEKVKGPYTYEQEVVQGDGTVANVYASGDQYYNYLHDEDGFILTKGGDGNLYYAVEKDGRPTPSSVRYNSPKYLVNSIVKMGYDDIDFDANADLLNSYYTTADSQPLMSSVQADSVRTVYNVTIFIQFADEDTTVVNKALTDSLSLYGNDEEEVESIRSFYKDMSGGQVLINNCFAYTDVANTVPFVYTIQDKTMQDFQVAESASTATRAAKEKELLSGAMEAFDSQYKGSYTDADFDIDDDGCFDSVCFVLLAKTSSSWGSLLWPHKWSASAIGMTNTITIGGSTLKCGDYSFSFGYTATGKYDFAVACHEMGHVFSAPDYYSYQSGVSYSFAGTLDLMGDTTDGTPHPSYMTAYTRDRYLKGLKGNITTVNTAQSVTLTAVTEASATDTVAIKIPTTTDGVYVMAEYRSNLSTSTYDNSIGGRGVIVYRVNEKATGNTAATSADNYQNIELSMYRVGTDISTAFLDSAGDYFTNLRLNASTTLDVTIEVTNINSTTATVEVRGGGLEDVEPVPDDYFLDKVEVTSATMLFDEDAYLFGVDAVVTMDSTTDLSKLSTMTVSLVDSLGNDTHVLTANREALRVSAEGGDWAYEVRFDLLAPTGEESWFFGERLTDNTPVAVTVAITDIDQDVIPIEDATKEIDDTSYLWENVFSVARYYDLFAIYFSSPFAEVKQGATFTVPLPQGRGGRDMTFAIAYSSSSPYITITDYQQGTLTVATDAPLGIYTVDFVAETAFGEVSATYTLNVVTEYNSYATVTASSDKVSVGTLWQDVNATVTIDGASVPLKNTTQLSYDRFYFTENASTRALEQEVKFSYNNGYYKTTISMVDALMAVNLGTPSFELFPTDTAIPSTTPISLYYWGKGMKTGTIALLTAPDAFSYTLPTEPSTKYVPVAYSVTFGGETMTSHFNFFRVSVVDGSITPSGNTVTDGSTTYYVASTQNSAVNYGDFGVYVTLNRGSGQVTYLATYGGSPFSIVGLPTSSGDYLDTTVTVRYQDGGKTYDLGTTKINFRILKTVVAIEVTATQTGYTSIATAYNSAVAFYIDEYDRGAYSFQYVLTFDEGGAEEVVFDLNKMTTVKEGLFSFTSTEWGLSKTFYFYGVDVVKSIEVQDTAYYGEGLPTTFAGTTYLDKEWSGSPTVTGYDDKGALKVAQTVTLAVVYNSSTASVLPYERTVTFTKSVTTVDGVYEIVGVQLVDTVFDYDEQMTTDYLELLTYRSYYQHYSADTSLSVADLSRVVFSTLDHSLLAGTTRKANTTLTVTYEGKSIDVAVTLNNGIASKRIKDSGFSKDTLYKMSGSPSITYELTYQNGTVETVVVPFGEYTLVDGVAFTGEDLGLHKVVVKDPNVSGEYIADPKSPLNLFIYVYAETVYGLETKTGQEVSTIVLKYGDVLDLTGYYVLYHDGTSNCKKELKRNYYRYTLLKDAKFASVELGVLSTSPDTYRGVTATVPVKILSKVNDEVLRLKEGVTGIAIDHDKGVVMLDSSTTKAALKEMLTTDERFSLKHPDVWGSNYAGGYQVVGNKKSLYTVSIVNRDGTVVEGYQVLLKGDGNGDGIRDLSDLESFALALLTGSDEYIDGFADGKFTLEDFVKQIVDRTTEGQETPLPLAELFVCEYRLKEDEIC